VRRDGKEWDYQVHSALVYLVCPRLVEKLSTIEGKSDRGLQRYEKWLRDNPPAMNQMLALHADAPQFRREIIGEEMWQELTALPPSHLAHLVMQTGRCGLSRRKVGDVENASGDTVKCLHYHLADYFLRDPPPLLSSSSKVSPTSNQPRGPVNVVGQKVFDELVESGFEVDGTEDCWTRCKGCGNENKESVG
jgi:hypothetical protein